jgi:hypothetical protein
MRPTPSALLRRAAGLLLATLSAAALLLACGGGLDPTKAQLRLVNASGFYDQLDLVVDGDVVRRDVAFGADAAYADVEAGTPDVDVTRAGSATALNRSNPTLSRGDHHTLVAYGREGALRTVLLRDEEGEPDRGTARVRVLNAAPEAGSLDVYLTASDETLTDAAPLQAQAEVGAAGAFVEVDAATWRLRVTGAGDPADLRLDIDGLVLDSRQIATVVLTPGSGGVLVQALRLAQQGRIEVLAGAHARVRANAGVGSVVARAGGVTLLDGSSVPAVGDYQLVPAGTPTVALTVDGAPVAVPAQALAAGSVYSLLVRGSAGAPVASWLADDNRPPTVATRARIRLVHGVGGLDAPLSMTLDATPVAESVPAGTASTPKDVDARTDGRLRVTASGQPTLFEVLEL